MKICFWGEIGNAIKGSTIGGGELQMAMLGKSLALAGHEVVVIDPFINESFTSSEGIKVFHIPSWNKGLPGLRIFTHRIPSLYKLLLNTKADFYYARMRSYLHLLSYLAARKNNGKFIMALASDFDNAGFWKRFKYEYWPKFNLISYLSHYLINDVVYDKLKKKADYITLQHSGQRLTAKSIRGKQAIFPNIFDFRNLNNIDREPGDYIVSAGSLTMLKGVDQLYYLLEGIDRKNKVVIVGDPRDKKSRDFFNKMTMDNVARKGRLKHAETLQMIANAKALINTSKFEGFPNIFLEAWAAGVPVISLNVNPGNVITEFGLGIYCEGSIEKMRDCINTDKISAIDKDKLVSFVREHHDFERAGERFLRILNS
ncbi:MAG TPA: glycosyltransferase [Chitinophagaceae bacterium]|nr:glycosyltransferase [Chitinophagaceae bacterium]